MGNRIGIKCGATAGTENRDNIGSLVNEVIGIYTMKALISKQAEPQNKTSVYTQKHTHAHAYEHAHTHTVPFRCRGRVETGSTHNYNKTALEISKVFRELKQCIPFLGYT
ncbi:hypothetical protein EVAR_98778_1 [Eumeta japonica]|uniref:Uncharacterized protein n=1 Tax=Eumeta variegata TaxID=151549 RepID=A0A4C1YY59_EUMVA|nr:hypothetical protein EVAR_98778_1 [Eumeta japonica]